MQKINSFSVATLVVCSSGAPFWGILTSYILYTSKNASLISLLLGFVLSLIISFLIIKFHSLYPTLSLADKFKKLFGKASKLIIIINALIILFIYIALAYRLTTFLSAQYLVETPKIYFHILILLTTSYISFKGIEGLSRLSTLSFYIAMFIFAFDILSLIQYIKIDNILPILDSKPMEIIKSGVLSSIYFSIPTYFICIVKKDDISDQKKFTKYYYIFYILSFLVIFGAIFVTLSIYGINLANIFDYPLYTVLKRIKLFSFIDSVENISIMLWILYVVNACSLAIYNVNTLIMETFNIKKIIVYIITISISFFLPFFLLMNNNYIETYNYVYIPGFVGLLALFLIILSLIKSKKKM